VLDQMSAPTPDGEAITAEGLQALEAEITELETVGRRDMAARINAARELGDLKENAEYHIAKDDQAHLETRIRRLRRRLRDAVVMEPDASAATFAFGRTADVRDEESDRLHTWTIVGATEADVTAGRLSVESPVARALLGASAGAVVAVATPRGTRRYRVERLLP
jgi:transcription elongation factor GreA